MLRFVPFTAPDYGWYAAVARLFGIVSAVGAFHRLRRTAQFKSIDAFSSGSDFPGSPFRLFQTVTELLKFQFLSQFILNRCRKGPQRASQPTLLRFLPLLAIVAAPTQ